MFVNNGLDWLPGNIFNSVPARLLTSWNLKLLFQLVCQWAGTNSYLATQPETENSISNWEYRDIQMNVFPHAAPCSRVLTKNTQSSTQKYDTFPAINHKQGLNTSAYFLRSQLWVSNSEAVKELFKGDKSYRVLSEQMKEITFAAPRR